MKQRLFDFYASMYWAILPEHLQEMYDIYRAAIDRKGIGIDFDPEAVAAKIGRPLDNARKVTVRDGVAVIPVLGPIFPRANIFTEISNATSIDVLATDFNAALNDRDVHSIVFDINTPGGAVDGVSEFSGMLYNARGVKPIIGYSGNMAASAGYWILSSTGESVIGDTSSLGSIGVVGGLRLSKDKDHVEFVSSQSPNKRPDPLTESGRAQFQSHVDALADVFIKTVARNRNMSEEDVISKGGAGGLRVGQHAVAAGLADRIGTLEGVISELQDPDLRSKRINFFAQKQESVILTDSETSPPTIGADEMPDKDKPADDAQPKDVKPDANVKPPVEAKTDEAEAMRAAKEKAEAEAKTASAALAAEQVKRVETEGQLKALTETVAQMQKDARTKDFTAMAKEWSGEAAVHVDMLEHLATSSEGGQESTRFKAYVTQQNAVAEQLRQSALFKEMGSGAPAQGSALEEIDSKARKRAAESGGKQTYNQAYDAIYASDAALRVRVDAEERRAVN